MTYLQKLMTKRKFAEAMQYPFRRENGDGDMWDKPRLLAKPREEVARTFYLRLSMDATEVLKTVDVSTLRNQYHYLR